MTDHSTIAAAVALAYPGFIQASAAGFYWENADTPPARFTFPTFEEAANDAAESMGLRVDEARSILQKAGDDEANGFADDLRAVIAADIYTDAPECAEAVASAKATMEAAAQFIERER